MGYTLGSASWPHGEGAGRYMTHGVGMFGLTGSALIWSRLVSRKGTIETALVSHHKPFVGENLPGVELPAGHESPLVPPGGTGDVAEALGFDGFPKMKNRHQVVPRQISSSPGGEESTVWILTTSQQVSFPMFSL